MTTHTLDLSEISQALAADTARSLSAWQVLDIALVARQGHMLVNWTDLGRPTQRLVSERILARSKIAPTLIAGPRFDAILRALKDLGKIREGAE